MERWRDARLFAFNFARECRRLTDRHRVVSYLQAHRARLSRYDARGRGGLGGAY